MDTLKDREKDEDLRKRLTAEQYRVTQEKHTEPPYANKYWNCNDGGVYKCICCDTELFESDVKHTSGCGWPCFTNPIDDETVTESIDTSLGAERTAIACAKCGAHLGHKFPDDDEPTKEKYCINSSALNLNKRPEESAE